MTHMIAIPAELHAQNNHSLATKVRNRRASLRGKVQSVVYFIQRGEDGPIKIGWTNNIDARQDELQIACAEPLFLRASLLGDSDLEKKVHRFFADHRIRGEWFEAEPVLKALQSARFLGREEA